MFDFPARPERERPELWRPRAFAYRELKQIIIIRTWERRRTPLVAKKDIGGVSVVQ